MSLFPKRTVPGGSVTIHWNLTLPAGMESAVCPYVRIGINTPNGETHMLFEEHVLLLPSTAAPAPSGLQQSDGYQYLNKHTPLRVLASYLEGQHAREKLTDILTNIQNGRHYYFTWLVPPGAAPGKYTLLSEMYINGFLKYSATANEDFFYVEQLDIAHGGHGKMVIRNPGPERVPAKLITYAEENHLRPEAVEVWYLEAGESRTVITTGKSVFLVYNEERITIPLHNWQQPHSLRNQQLLSLRKEEAGQPVTYVLPREGQQAWQLTKTQQTIWEAANGMRSAAQLRATDSDGYDEMLAHGIITEIP
jgi:mannose-6-phosphate isomerase-like protein (cupin superfamily)